MPGMQLPVNTRVDQCCDTVEKCATCAGEFKNYTELSLVEIRLSGPND